jgi:hypothetical protein
MRALDMIYHDPDLHNIVKIKMFLPLDMRYGIRDWTYQHLRQLHHDISWKADDLRAFISRRIEIGRPEKLRLTKRDFEFEQAWNDLFGKSTRNGKTEIFHDSLDYVLRHTLARPRQLLMFCRYATEQAFKRGTDALSGQDLITTVRDFCRDQYSEYIEEYAVCYANLDGLLHAFDQCPNILDADTVRRRIRNFSLAPWMREQGELIQFLYDIGFLGIHKELQGNVEKDYPGIMRTVVGTTTHLFYFVHTRKSAASHEASFVVHPFFYDVIDPEVNNVITVGHKMI